MKLLIQNPLTIQLNPLLHEDNFNNLRDIVERFNIYCTFHIEENYIELHVQKITLDEFDMNELFCDFLFELTNYKLTYVERGKGCEFALKLEFEER